MKRNTRNLLTVFMSTLFLAFACFIIVWQIPHLWGHTESNNGGHGEAEIFQALALFLGISMILGSVISGALLALTTIRPVSE